MAHFKFNIDLWVEGETEEDTVTYTAPTCENKGYKAIYCNECDAYKDLEKFINAYELKNYSASSLS